MALIVKTFATHKSIKKPMPLILQKIKNEEKNLKRKEKVQEKTLFNAQRLFFIIKKFKKFKKTT
jgi:hypothetical protein